MIKFKPCDQLSANDFEEHSLWGFDVSMEGASEEADESWVRPFEYPSIPKSSDVLFATAAITAGDHPTHRGAITFRVVAQKPVVDSCVLFTPRYCSIPLELPALGPLYLQMTLGDALPSYFPIHYEATIRFGKQSFPISGTLPLPKGLEQDA